MLRCRHGAAVPALVTVDLPPGYGTETAHQVDGCSGGFRHEHCRPQCLIGQFGTIERDDNFLVQGHHDTSCCDLADWVTG